MAGSPLAAPTLCLEAEEAGAAKLQLHVSSAVLEKMPYFRTRLSERWREAGAGALYVRLPEGCGLEALAVLLERLHFPSAQLGPLDLGLALQLVQLASMFVAEGDGLLTELMQALRESVRTRHDTEALRAFCARIAPPQCMARLAAGFERRDISTMMRDSQLGELLRNALVAGDAVAFEVAQKIMRQRHRGGAEPVAASACLLRQLLLRGAAPSEGTTQGKDYLTFIHREWCEPDSEASDQEGTQHFSEKESKGLAQLLAMTSRFVFAYPAHFSELAPLMFPKVGLVCFCGSSVRTILKKALMEVFEGCFREDGGGRLPAESLRGLILALISNGHAELLGARLGLGQPRITNASFVSFLGRAPIDVKTCVCDALCLIESKTLCSVVTRDMMGDLPDPLRQQLCLAVVPNIHLLCMEVKALVLAEVSAADADSDGDDEDAALASGGGGSAGSFRAKRPRRAT